MERSAKDSFVDVNPILLEEGVNVREMSAIPILAKTVGNVY